MEVIFISDGSREIVERKASLGLYMSVETVKI